MEFPDNNCSFLNDVEENKGTSTPLWACINEKRKTSKALRHKRCSEDGQCVTSKTLPKLCHFDGDVDISSIILSNEKYQSLQTFCTAKYLAGNRQGASI
jgi:hypothetical protein